MTPLLWSGIIAQVVMGAVDTLAHHEATRRLAWRPSQALELRLHGARNLSYGATFLLMGWMELTGTAALALLMLMAFELGITLWDVEEDRTRMRAWRSRGRAAARRSACPSGNSVAVPFQFFLSKARCGLGKHSGNKA